MDNKGFNARWLPEWIKAILTRYFFGVLSWREKASNYIRSNEINGDRKVLIYSHKEFVLDGGVKPLILFNEKRKTFYYAAHNEKTFWVMNF
jgi:hypothetical protein